MKLSTELKLIGPFSNHSHQIQNSDHIVHFYDQVSTLTDAVCNFIVPGLTSNNGILLIAASENIKKFEKALERRSIDVAKAKTLHQLVLMDAEEVLSQFMVNDEPDRQKFFTTITPHLKKMNKKYPFTRAYGEMVNILWHKNLQESAIKLELLWNELAQSHQFCLFCGYKIDGKTSSQLEDVCQAHTHVVSKDGKLKTTVKA
jgi:hypothetical protein